MSSQPSCVRPTGVVSCPGRDRIVTMTTEQIIDIAVKLLQAEWDFTPEEAAEYARQLKAALAKA